MIHTPRGGTVRPRYVLGVVTATEFLGELCYMLVIPVLPLQAREAGWSELAVGVLLGTFGLASAAVTPLVGWFVRRLGMRRAFLGALVLLAIATGLYAVSSAYGGLLAARTCQGLAQGLTAALGLAYVAKVHSETTRGRAFGIAAGGLAMGAIAGPFIGGVLADLIGQTATFLGVAGCVTAVFGLAAVVMPTDHSTNERTESFTILLRDTRLRQIAICAVLGAFILGMLETVVPLRLQAQHGATPTVIGLVFMAVAIAQAVASPLVGTLADRWGTRRVTLAGLNLCVLGLVTLAVAPSVAVVTTAVVLVGLAITGTLVPVLAGMSQLIGVDSDFRSGPVYALFVFCLDLGMMIGPPLGGLMLGQVGFVMTVLLFACGLVTWAWLGFARNGVR